MIREVQRVYRLQGVEINDKHIEMIVSQMLKEDQGRGERAAIDVLPGVSMDVLDFNEMNEELLAEGKEPAEGKQVMLGITKGIPGNRFLLICRILPGDDQGSD